MRQARPDLDALGVAVLVVTFETPDRARRYVAEFQVPWPVLVDTTRQLYQQFAMPRGSGWAIFGPRSWLGYVRLLLGGRRLAAPTGDIHQLGGDVLIDPRGIVQYHHVSQGPTDRPAVKTLLTTVRQGSR